MKVVSEMFMGYEAGQWIQLILYMLFIATLGVGAFAVSCIITNKFLHKKNNKKKLEKKSYFVDVA
jgi:hypothetical protein